jgi:uncharacterized protein involved in exopolysaccharide biosynthesis
VRKQVDDATKQLNATRSQTDAAEKRLAQAKKQLEDLRNSMVV